MQSKSEGEDVECLQYTWMFLTCSEVVQDTVDGSSLGNYHTSPFSQKLHHTCNNYRLQQPTQKINKCLRGKSGWEAMIIKTRHCLHANVLLAQVAWRDCECPNELYSPPTPPIIITWPSKWIAWQANTTLVSYANILYVRQHMTLHKDCVTSQHNVSIHHKGSFSS